MEIEVFEVRGMKCAGCGRRIEEALESLPGVTSASADHDAGTVEGTYDSSLVTVDALKNVIEGEGYIVLV